MDVIQEELKVLNKIHTKLEQELKLKTDSSRVAELKIKEFKRLMQGNYVKVVGNSRGDKKRNPKPLYYTPAKESTKIEKDSRSNSSRKTLDDTFKQDNQSEVESYHPSTKPHSLAPKNILTNRSVKEENEEEEYGSDFDEYYAGNTSNAKAGNQ